MKDEPDFDKARYRAFGDAKFATYVKKSQYDWIKSDQRLTIRRLETHPELTRPGIRLADIATGSGQFLFHVKQRFPEWALFGYDYTQQFIDVAKAFPGLAGVNFECCDMYTITEKFDVVTMLGTLPTFQDFTEPMGKMWSMVKPGGRLIVDGYFNRSNIDVRVVFRDNSVEETRGIWRTHYNHHSESTVREWLSAQSGVASFEFIDMPMQDEIARDAEKPHVNAWTFHDDSGNILVTNGTNIVLRTRMLDILKST